ncbi:MAG: aminodeoxychorismate/anthranilate synthase component II [Deferribacterota bacterium]|nr:aminodeoxychorismate/anthranilate synthase component II [Deferribacterota bacterium]
MYLIVDNYDSFTYNLYTLFFNIGVDCKVVKNDAPLIEEPSLKGIIISPGPSHPSKSLNSIKYIDKYKGRLPILGVCLGMQTICFNQGYTIRRSKLIRHGKVDKVRKIKDSLILKGIDNEFEVVRYHSLVVEADDDYVTSRSICDNEAMSFEDRDLLLFGVQFHPESFLSKNGKIIAKNFIDICEGY